MAITATYISPTQFSVNGDYTTIFIKDRRVKANCSGTYKYGTILSVIYIPNITTITLTSASDDIDVSLIEVEVGIVSAGTESSLPIHSHDGGEGSGGPLASSASTFISLGDTPDNYDDGKYARSTTSGVEWAEINLDPTEEGIETITSGTDQVSVIFSAEQDSAVYSLNVSIENTIDTFPSQYSYSIISKSTTGFTILISNPVDSENYKLNWRIGGILSGGGSGVSDHGLLSGLGDDDHSQYFNQARGDARYSQLNHDHPEYALSSHTHGQYALATDLTTASGTLQSEIDNHNHDTDYLALDGGTITNDLTINGNLTVQGTTITANTETVLIEDNLLVINATESGSGVSLGHAGIEVERGSETNYLFYFQESDDTFRIGISGSLQPVATREDTPISNGYARWNATQYRFDTVSGVSVSSLDTDLALNGHCINYGTILTVSGSYVGEIIIVQVDDTNSDYGQVLCQGSDFNYDRADADSSTTAPVFVMALEAGSGAKKVLLKGQICNSTWNLNAGKVYLSTVAGGIVQTVVSGTTDQIQVLGWALASGTVLFNPTYMVAEVV